MQSEKCPYCGDLMAWDGLSYLWHCLQPECPIDDLNEEELAELKAGAEPRGEDCPECGGSTSGILNSDWRRCDECLHDFLPEEVGHADE